MNTLIEIKVYNKAGDITWSISGVNSIDWSRITWDQIEIDRITVTAAALTQQPQQPRAA